MNKDQYKKNLKELQQSIKSKVKPEQLMKNHPEFKEGWWKDEQSR